ncbi:hypothetical protein GPL21_33165 [Bradyrhizobium pachyrhizi]|uniref:Apea-like HEPN domain-containing protein n=1 Tax=Bradyrhizobium pachyrhizi TaxID=280333 RepID=A0A844T5L7_9BRAD|nr:HEPN domain-containing protein [Bradyrhizobium pachyrhizi]MVT69940.1 hypothetical protein [Bradyrhizobium pachyrhizi]
MNGQVEEGSLRPNERIQKLLLSTPAHFVGQFESPSVLISLAWPPTQTGRTRWFGGNADSLNRTAIALVFRTPVPSEPEPRIVIPNYEGVGEFVASALSVLFGKRFDTHGPLEMSGYFGVPDLSSFLTPCSPRLRHNDGQSRADRAVPLNLSEVGRIIGLIMESNKDNRFAAFHSAAKFYRRALISVEDDVEGAYLNLITAGEIISNVHELNEDDVLDAEARDALNRVARLKPDGAELATFLRGRLRGVKRRFVSAITAMVDDSFFERTEADDRWTSFRKDDFQTRIAAAYDLRSRFVHSGYPFGGWIRQPDWEVQGGKPVVSDKEMAKVLAKAPLFKGLERVIRYVLLSFAAELGATVEVDTEKSPTD